MIKKIDIEILRHFKTCNSIYTDELELKYDPKELTERSYLFMQKGYFEKCGDLETYKLNERGLKLLADMEEEYKSQEIKPTHVTNISNSIVGNTVHGDVNQTLDSPVSQSRDDLSRLIDKTQHKTINPPTEAEISKSPNNWTLSNITFVVSTGVLIGIILFYWPVILDWIKKIFN
jgi:hypothetical protein